MKNIDNIFNDIKNAEIPDFPLSNDQVRTILDNVDSSKSANPTNFNGVLKMILKSSIILSFVAASLYFGLLNDDGALEKHNAKSESIDNVEQSAAPQAEEYVKELIYNDENSIYLDISDKSSYKDTLEILMLSDNELKKLFINKFECGYTYITEPVFPLSHNKVQMEELFKLGYPKKGYKRFVESVTIDNIADIGNLPYTNWDMNASCGIFPQNSKLLKYEKYQDGYRLSFASAPSQIVTNDVNICNNVLYDKLSPFFNKNRITNNKKAIKVIFGEKDKEALSSIVPILLIIQDEKFISYCVVTYPKTQSLISLLPNRFKLSPNDKIFDGIGAKPDYKDIEKSYNKFLSEQKDLCGKSKRNERTMPNIKKVNSIIGIEKLLLTPEEALQLGIEFTPDSLIFNIEELRDLGAIPEKAKKFLKEQFNYPTDTYTLIKQRISVSNYLNDINEKLHLAFIKYDGWSMKEYSNFSPVAMSYKKVVLSGSSVSFSHSFQSPLMWNDSLEYIDNLIIDIDSSGEHIPIHSRIIPVVFSSTKLLESGDTLNVDFQIWYVVSEEFAGKLPERYRTPILQELSIAKIVESGAMPIDLACEIMKGEVSYLGLCSIANSQVSNIGVHPNPIKNSSATLIFQLKEAGKYKIELYDSNGEYVDLLEDFKFYSQGRQSLSLMMPSVSSGIYLLSIVGENNNRAVVKVMF